MLVDVGQELTIRWDGLNMLYEYMNLFTWQGRGKVCEQCIVCVSILAGRCTHYLSGYLSCRVWTDGNVILIQSIVFHAGCIVFNMSVSTSC